MGSPESRSIVDHFEVVPQTESNCHFGQSGMRLPLDRLRNGTNASLQTQYFGYSETMIGWRFYRLTRNKPRQEGDI